METKKAISLFCIVLSSLSAGFAQTTDSKPANYVSQPETASTSVISFGFGMGGYYPNTGASSLESPNLTLIYDNTIVKNAGIGYISLGGLFSYKSVFSNFYEDYNSPYNYEQDWNYYIIGARLAYHLNPFLDKSMELYAGAMMGYYITTFNFISNDPDYSNPSDPAHALIATGSPDFFAPTIFAGISSTIIPHVRVWFEAGYGYSTVAYGLSYAF